jgi:G:T-mismatch repair DNA endonuclease (very short patch repair protein)
MGWRSLVIFECALKKPAAVKARLAKALARSPRLCKTK